MFVHKCQKCGHVSINRIAGDDDPEMILDIFEKSLHKEESEELEKESISLLKEKDREEIKKQLFGKEA